MSEAAIAAERSVISGEGEILRQQVLYRGESIFPGFIR